MSKKMEIERIIAKKVNELGGQTYYVGGYVRDQFLGIENKDLDIEVHGISPDDLYKILSSIGEPLSYGKSFGVYSLKGYNIDIALPRSEVKTGERHKDFKVDVDPYIGTTKAIQRRDFTINAIYKNVLTGEVIDPFNGVEDIKNGIIKHVDESSFPEDPLRVLRACQFASRFNFNIDKKTIRICIGIDITTLSKQRVEEELKKCLLKGKPSIFFKYLGLMHHFRYWFKGIFETNDKSVMYRDEVENKYEFMLAALTLNSSKKQATEFLNRIVTKKKVIDYVLNMHELARRKVKSDYSINKLFYDCINPKELIYLRMTMHANNRYLFKKLDKYNKLMSKPYVKGKDLLALGIEPSDQFTQILNYANKLRLKGFSKEEVLKKIKKLPIFKSN